jgi:hypothetical protein
MALRGIGIWAWILSHVTDGDPVKGAALAKRMGASRVYVKVADGASRQNAGSAEPFADALRAVGIEVWAWSYQYDHDAAAQAGLLASRAKSIGATGLIINAEKEFADEADDARKMTALLDETRKAWTGPLGVSSFGRIDFFPRYPWHVFAGRGLIGMPQVYGYEGANRASGRAQVAVENYAALGFAEVVPTFGAFVNDSMTHSPESITSALRRVAELSDDGLCSPAADLWSLQHILGHPNAEGVVGVSAHFAGEFGVGHGHGEGHRDLPLDKPWQVRAALLRLGAYRGPLFGTPAEWAPAVRAFQQAHPACGRPDGVVGPLTMTAIRAALATQAA